MIIRMRSGGQAVSSQDIHRQQILATCVLLKSIYGQLNEKIELDDVFPNYCSPQLPVQKDAYDTYIVSLLGLSQ